MSGRLLVSLPAFKSDPSPGARPKFAIPIYEARPAVMVMNATECTSPISMRGPM